MEIAFDLARDRFTELKQFDDTKRGVKGLVDAGLTTIPCFFVHPPETLSDIPQPPRATQPNTATNNTPANTIIPTIDLSGVASSRRPGIVEEVARAARELGFFQVVNHGVPMELLERVFRAIRNFHEQPIEERARFYHREQGPVVALFSNGDLFRAKAACWRDTLQIKVNEAESLEELPEVCRVELMEWDQQVKDVADIIMELLCEGLGLDPGKLKETRCLETRVLVGHYYPKCPQPDLTFGMVSHTDPGVLTVLLQDHIGGLQVKHDGGWLDVKPVPGALVINIGDILEIMSNDEYTSAEHRALANPSQEARISVTTFFSPGARDALSGPISDTFFNRAAWVMQAELNSIGHAVQETETEMLLMSELNHCIATKVLERIDFLYDLAVGTTEYLELGNKELSEAIQRIKSSWTFLLLFLFVVAFSAIFLGWYG